MELKCPVCGKVNISNNIMDGCYQFWCADCKKPYESHIVDMEDFSDGEIKNYSI